MAETDVEAKLSAALRHVADGAPRYSPGVVKSNSATAGLTASRDRHRRGTGLLAAAAVLAVIGGGAWATATLNDHHVPAEQAPAAPLENDDPTSSPVPLGSADEVREMADRLSLYKEVGFGKVTVDLDAREVRVYWKGEPPRRVREAVGDPASRVRVVLVPVDYSEVELLAAARKVMTFSRLQLGVRVSRVSQAPDLSGLVVAVPSADFPGTDAERELLRATFEQIAGVPVHSLVRSETADGLTG
jgi:hypothetical protein